MKNTNMNSVNRVVAEGSWIERRAHRATSLRSGLRRLPETPLCRAIRSVNLRAAKRPLRRLAGLVYESYRWPAWLRLRRFLFRLFDFAFTCVFVSHATQHATISYLWRHFEDDTAMFLLAPACLILDANRGRATRWILRKRNFVVVESSRK